MPPAIEIRPPVAADIPRLIALDHSLSSEAVWQLELRRDSAEQFSASFREVRLPRPTAVTFPYDPRALAEEWTRASMMRVALTEGRPAGYLCLQERPGAQAAWVAKLAVDYPYRRQGMGGALLQAAETWAAQKPLRRLILETQSKNLPMIRLAQKFGYEFCGYNDRYFPTLDVALFFGKDLK